MNIETEYLMFACPRCQQGMELPIPTQEPGRSFAISLASAVTCNRCLAAENARKPLKASVRPVHNDP